LRFAATTEGGHRLYDEADTISQMARVKLMAARGLSLPQIRVELGPDAKKRVLVVDDEPEVGDVVKDALSSRHPFDIRIAMDGFSAGRMMLDVLPDLVVLDLMLPGVNGFDVCRTVKIDLGITGIRIVMVTGHDMDKGYEAGADYCLSKPFTPGEILEAAVEMLESLSVPLSRN